MSELNTLKIMQERRRDLRKNMTPAEAALWKKLQRQQLGERFLRQYSIGYYVVDFYCPKYKLAIELDGEVHFSEERQEYDKKRTEFLNSVGVNVIRFENCQVFKSTEWLLERIKEKFKLQQTTLNPSPLRGTPLKLRGE